MSWLKEDDAECQHPRWERLGTGAYFLWKAARQYVSAQATDGVVSHARMMRLTFVESPEILVSKLLDEGLLALMTDDAGFAVYVVVGWEQWIFSAQEQDRRRLYNAEKARRSRLHKQGDHSLCLPSSRCRDRSRDRVRDVVTDHTPTRPDPKGVGSGTRLPQDPGASAASTLTGAAATPTECSPGCDGTGWVQDPDGSESRCQRFADHRSVPTVSASRGGKP